MSERRLIPCEDRHEIFKATDELIQVVTENGVTTVTLDPSSKAGSIIENAVITKQHGCIQITGNERVYGYHYGHDYYSPESRVEKHPDLYEIKDDDYYDYKPFWLGYIFGERTQKGLLKSKWYLRKKRRPINYIFYGTIELLEVVQ